MNLKLTTIAASVGMLLVGAATALSQTSVYINNANFASPAVSGTYTYDGGSAGAYTTLTGWTNVATSAGIWSVINSPSGATNVDGSQIVEAFAIAGTYSTAGVIYQELTNTWIAGATYTLTVKAGYPGATAPHIPATGDTVSLDILNSGTLSQIASTAIPSTSGGLYNNVVTYTATGTEAGDGHIVVAFHQPAQTANDPHMWVNKFTLTYLPPPDPGITTQPKSTFTTTNGPASFRVTASGLYTLIYQWQATNNSTGFTNITGATASTLTVSGLTPSSALNYRVVVTDTAGSITSSVASVGFVPSGLQSLYIANNSFCATKLIVRPTFGKSG